MDYPTLLIKDASCIATMDNAGTEWRDASILIRGQEIIAAGPTHTLPEELMATAKTIIHARGHVVVPGLVNTHHHMFQSLTRAMPVAQDAELFEWLRSLYPVWARLTPDMIKVSTQVAMAELLLSGCTTSSDHLYLYPNGIRLDDSIEAAQGMGMRFHASRGSMSLGESAGGLPPDMLVENEADILRDSRRVIEAYHDPSRFSMLRIALAPCSPFSVSQSLMRESARLARSYKRGVRLHTHLAENDHDVAFSHEHFRCSPSEYAESLEWLGEDVWHAHCVKLDDHGIQRFAATGTGVSHCPCSNMRLSSGIAPVRRMRQAGVHVSLGVDGSASNDASNMLAEARQALLLARVSASLTPFGCELGPKEMSARDALWLATRGGAQVLGRNDVGHIAVGMAADLAIFDLNTLSMAGAAVHDPVASLMLTHGQHAAWTIVNGRVVVDHGRLTTVNLQALVARHNHHARHLQH
jgi:8-oxoguanine deaminase